MATQRASTLEAARGLATQRSHALEAARGFAQKLSLALAFTLAFAFAAIAAAQNAGEAPAPPSDVHAADHPLDGGGSVDVTWALSPDDGDPAKLAGYRISRTMTPQEATDADRDAIAAAIKSAKAAVTTEWRERLKESKGDPNDPAEIARIREAREQAAAEAKARVEAEITSRGDATQWKFVTIAPPGTKKITVDDLSAGAPYRFAVEAISPDGARSSMVESVEAASPAQQWFDGGRRWLAVITFVLCASVVMFIWLARTGIPLKVRKIAGLEAVDEAVGRATEMGRSCLFIPGIQDMNDIQTIAGLTVLSRVAKTAAEYDAKIEVPTSRSLVMTTARETVQSAFLAAGRPDAYNEDLIYYVTDEQFGYVAYLSGMMVREKPAACFYMGAFFAESLILAETGNSIGAIQVAGTAMPSQLPFFVAACDYTLIGEEFFAASAYLSGSPEELGSLKGQDVGKAIVAVGIVIGVFFASIAAIGVLTGNESLADSFGAVEAFIRETMLT